MGLVAFLYLSLEDMAVQLDKPFGLGPNNICLVSGLEKSAPWLKAPLRAHP